MDLFSRKYAVIKSTKLLPNFMYENEDGVLRQRVYTIMSWIVDKTSLGNDCLVLPERVLWSSGGNADIKYNC